MHKTSVAQKMSEEATIFTRGQFWVSGIVVACVRVCVCVPMCLSVCVSITC